MKEKKFDYYQVIIRKAENILLMPSLSEFWRFANACYVKQMIKTTDGETDSPCFAFSHKGAIYICPSSGFELLEDFVTAQENHFPDAESFYAARKNNCTTYAEYQLVLNTGIADTPLMEELKQKGYIDGYLQFEELRKKNPVLPQLSEITNVKELYDFASQKQFPGFPQFLKAWEAGFTDSIEYHLAIEKGLKTAEDYKQFTEGGFMRLEHFKKAKSLEIKTADEYKQYEDLEAVINGVDSFDQAVLLGIISKLESGEKTEFKKLHDFFLKTEEEYKRENGNGQRKLPKWYSKSLRTESDVRDFLTGSDEVKKFGTFDAAKNIFETIPIKRRKVVVDGSNVAYNSDITKSKTGAFGAEFKNILTLVKKLKEDYGFEDIQVMSDNNLIHRVKDKHLLRDIKALCKYSDMPPGVPADLFLINQVKKHHCLLVTNDNFRDWKLNDKWVEDNIDFYRLKFMINEEKVVLPYMERFEKV
jgi:hypothetical protein